MDTVDISVDSNLPASNAPATEPVEPVPLSQTSVTATPAPTSSEPLLLSVSPASPIDVPDLAALEMLAFVDDPISHHMNPLRTALVKTGRSPEKWPDYASILRRRHKSFVSGQMVFKATIIPDPDAQTGEKTVGMALMTPPKRLLLPVSIKGRIWGSVLYPTYDRLRKFMPDHIRGDGLDEVFAERFGAILHKTRVEVMQDREYFILNLLFTSSSHPRSGIGSSLLSHCLRITDAAHLPVILESTRAAVSLYEKHGFKTVKTCKLEYQGDVIEWPVMVREPVGGYVSGGEAGEGKVEVESLASETLM